MITFVKPCDRHFPSNFNRKQQLSPRRLGQPDDFRDAPVSYDGAGEQECLSAELTFIDAKCEADHPRSRMSPLLRESGCLCGQRFAADVVAVWETLPTDERARSVILAPHWVFASAIEYYGRDRDLSPVVAPHNAYWFWREEAAGRDIVVSVAVDSETLSR